MIELLIGAELSQDFDIIKSATVPTLIEFNIRTMIAENNVSLTSRRKNLKAPADLAFHHLHR